MGSVRTRHGSSAIHPAGGQSRSEYNADTARRYLPHPSSHAVGACICGLPRSCDPLHGLPIIVKDNYDVVGMPTTGGSVALANAFPARNAAVVERMIHAGAIVLAKANMSELATSAGKSGYSSVLGVTLNPYNLKR